MRWCIEYETPWKVPDFIPTTLWPPNSPDLNPVDYSIWNVLQEKIYRSIIRPIANVKELETRLIDEWPRFDQSIVDAAIDQWPRRLSACGLGAGDTLSIRFQLVYNLGLSTKCCQIGGNTTKFWQNKIVFSWKLVKFSTFVFNRYCDDMSRVRRKLYILHLISAILSSTYQKLLKLMEIWRSSDINNSPQFFSETPCIYILGIYIHAG